MAEFWDEEAPRTRAPVPTGDAKAKHPRNRPAPAVPEPAPPEGSSVPLFDEGVAQQFAQLLAAGLSQTQATRYIVPSLRGQVLDRVAAKWANSRLVLDAVTALNAGAWHQLSDDQRISIALTQHRADCAYFLYTHRLEDASAEEMAKIEMAREVLEKFTQGAIDPTDPLAAFARAAKEIMAGALGPTPAQLAGATVDYREAPQLGRVPEDDVLN